MMLTGQQAAEITGGTLLGGADGVCTGIATDTRKISAGDLFVPLVGERFDGHDFIQRAVESGCCGALVQTGRSIALDQRVHVEVTDTLWALGELARAHLATLGLPVIGITGSNGKTSTKEMMACALSAYGSVLKNHGNHNNLIGLPQTALRADASHDYAVLEMGMSVPGEIERLAEIAAPRVGLITSVASAHLQGVGSIDGVRREKAALFQGLASDGVAVVNARDPQVRRAAEGLAARTITVGGPDSDIRVEGVKRRGVAGITATLHYSGSSYILELRTLARHDIWNAALAVGALAALGLDLLPGLQALRDYAGVPGRMAWKVTPDGVNVIDDTYNANPASMRSALQTLGELSAGRKIAVLGDMLELGDDTAELHEELGQMAADIQVDALFAVGEHAASVAEGFGGKTVCVNDADEVIEPLKRLVRRGDWVLVKGSRGVRAERVVQALMGGAA